MIRRAERREWPDAGYRFQQEFARDDQVFLESLAREVPGKVLSDSAGLQSIFHAQGKALIPLWSPEVAFICAADFPGDAVNRLRELGYSPEEVKQFEIDKAVRVGSQG